MKRDRKKLLVVSSTYPRWIGDHEPSFVHDLSSRLTDAFDVTVICPHARGAALEEKIEGVKIRRFRYAPEGLETLVHNGGIARNIKNNLWKALLLPSFFLSQIICVARFNIFERPDAIHAHWLIPQGLCVIIARFISFKFPPIIVTSHGADLYSLQSRVFKVLKVLVAKTATRLTVVSPPMKKELEGLGIIPKKISVIPMGTDLENKFTVSNKVRRKEKTVLFVGRFVEKKGIHVLIDSIPDVVRKVPGVQLKLIGFGPDELDLREKVRKLNIAQNVVFLGPKNHSDLPDYYREASVFVAPFLVARSGDQEGLGLVIVEALGCGCPVIVSNLPATQGFKRIVPDIELVEKNNVCQLSDAICSILRYENEQPLRSYKELYYLSALKSEFDWGSVAKRYQLEIQEMIDA